MQRRFTLQIVISVIIVACCASACWSKFHTYGLPFAATVVDARTAVIQHTPGIVLPAGVQTGDHIDLPALDQPTRAGIINFNLQVSLPPGLIYHFIINRDTHSISVPVTTVDLVISQRVQIAYWAISGFYCLMGMLALLMLWRGRGRAAAYMTFWLVFFLLGFVVSGVALEGIAGVSVQMGAIVCYLLARISFYLMIETLVGKILTPSILLLVRTLFILVLAAGAIVMMGGPITYMASGWAGLLLPRYGVIFTAGYLIPAVLLLLSYNRATLTQRPHIRWLLLSIAALLIGIFFSNTFVFDIATNAVVQSIFFVLCMSGFVYTVLRHRVVDISVVIDRTLVYGGMTALVVGVLAAVNNLVQHAALGTGASLLVQIVVPLALGIVLGQVRNYTDKFVERVFFRRKYLAGKALRHFARHCGGYENAEELVKATALIVHQKLAVAGIALYVRNGNQYIAVQRTGEVVYPESAKVDDVAFAAARSGATGMDLSQMHSVLGVDGYVFQVGAQAVMVCANRPGEHYASDERKLLAHVARQVGTALNDINVRESLDFVRAVASGVLTIPVEVQAKARALAAEI